MKIHTIDITQEVAELIGNLSVPGREPGHYRFKFQKRIPYSFDCTYELSIDCLGNYLLMDDEISLELISYSSVIDKPEIKIHINEIELRELLIKYHASK